MFCTFPSSGTSLLQNCASTTELKFSTTPSSTTFTHLEHLSYRYNQIHTTVAHTGSGHSRFCFFTYLINAVLKCPTVSGGVAMPAGFAASVGEIPCSHCRLPEAQPVRHGAASGPVPHGDGTQAAPAQGLRQHPATLHRQVGCLYLSARSASLSEMNLGPWLIVKQAVLTVLSPQSNCTASNIDDQLCLYL